MCPPTPSSGWQQQHTGSRAANNANVLANVGKFSVQNLVKNPFLGCESLNGSDLGTTNVLSKTQGSDWSVSHRSGPLLREPLLSWQQRVIRRCEFHPKLKPHSLIPPVKADDWNEAGCYRYQGSRCIANGHFNQI